MPRGDGQVRGRRSNYEVVVGNVGTVHRSAKGREAELDFEAWVEVSKLEVGRAAGEPVTLFKDGEPVREYEKPKPRPPFVRPEDPDTRCECGHPFSDHDGLTNAECGAYLDEAEEEPCACDEFMVQG